jgi:hypothetical protein
MQWLVPQCRRQPLRLGEALASWTGEKERLTFLPFLASQNGTFQIPLARATSCEDNCDLKSNSSGDNFKTITPNNSAASSIFAI